MRWRQAFVVSGTRPKRPVAATTPRLRAAATSTAKTAKAPKPGTAPTAAPPSGPALAGALATLLEPIARLAVARGFTCASVEDMLKASFVEAARQAQPPSAGERIVSRVATATGLSRREVTRLLDARAALPPARPAPATQVFTRWQADRSLHDKAGRPIALRRTGPAPSFETLARSVTQDVHPRSLLDELRRLGLVDVDGETVTLARDSVVAGADSDRAYRFLGSNVSDHLRAGVDNVLGATPPHVEQAVFADELSDASMAAFRDLARAQWQALLAAAVPALQALVDADAAAGRARHRRVRIGLYAFDDTMKDDDTPTAAPSPAAPPGRRRPVRKDQ